MKPIKIYQYCFILLVFLGSCTKESPEESNVIETSSNNEQVVVSGQPNCTEAISGKIKLKAVVDPDKSTAASISVKINSKTERLYPSGGYILVYDLSRTSSNIRLEYKQVNTACGNPAAAALLPATSSPLVSNLAVGSYPIEIIVNGAINKGVLNISPPPASPSLAMQTTNGIIIE